nr:cyclin-dependent kinase G-2-like [Physcomitrium patens]|eukprot:XP_024363927.1 cyclin-dependent kinase G-2-like [Physcomitrella patens]
MTWSISRLHLNVIHPCSTRYPPSHAFTRSSSCRRLAQLHFTFSNSFESFASCGISVICEEPNYDSVKDRLAERDRDRGSLPPDRDWDRGLHSRDDRRRGRDADWIIERERGDKDRITDREREGQSDRGDRDRNNERERIRILEGERGRIKEEDRERDMERGGRLRGRVADREPGEITISSRREGGEIGLRDHRGLPSNNASQVGTEAGRSTGDIPNQGIQREKKRKFNPIVWDLDDSKTGKQVSTSQAAPHLSTRFGPNSPSRPHQRSLNSSSPPTSLKLPPRNPDSNATESPVREAPHKSSSAVQAVGRLSSTVSPSGQVRAQISLKGKITVSPSLAGRVTDQRPGLKQSPSSSPSGQEVEINRSSERMSISPRPSSRGIDVNQIGSVLGAANGNPSAPRPRSHSLSSPSSLSSSFDAAGGSPAAVQNLSEKDVQSVDVHMQDVKRFTGTPDSDDTLEPGQLLDSPMLISKHDEGTPTPVTIGRSRWVEDTHSPEQSCTPTLPTSKARVQRSRSVDSDKKGRSPSTSPEPGEYRQDKTFQDSEEYERELNKKELQELDEDSGNEDIEEQQPEVDSEPEEVPVSSGPEHRAIDMLKGCRSVDEFEKLNKIDEGTYGVVFRARDKKTGELVALKKVKMEKERSGFPMTSLREINVLLSFQHPSIVDVKEVVVGVTVDHIFMVMEYMEHDLKGLMETMKQPFSQSEVKCLMLQLFDGIKYLHDNWVLHRDLKTSNLLLNNRGELKICDFGLARQYGDPLKEYTHEVVTLWYRAPELLLGARKYSTAIDMWSLGCIMAEFLAKEPLFPGKSPIDEIDKIFKTLGTPNEKIWPDFVKLPGVRCNFTKQPYNKLREKFPATSFSGRPTLSEKGFDLLNRLLTYDPSKRITAEEALKHDWFREVPLPKAKEFMPTFPVRSEHDRRIRRLMKSPDPLEEQRKRELKRAEVGGGGLFG